MEEGRFKLALGHIDVLDNKDLDPAGDGPLCRMGSDASDYKRSSGCMENLWKAFLALVLVLSALALVRMVAPNRFDLESPDRPAFLTLVRNIQDGVATHRGDPIQQDSLSSQLRERIGFCLMLANDRCLQFTCRNLQIESPMFQPSLETGPVHQGARKEVDRAFIPYVIHF